MNGSRRRGSGPPQAPTYPPSTVLRWRLLLQAFVVVVFGAFFAVATIQGAGLDMMVGSLGILAGIGGAIDALLGHRYESSLLRRIATESYRASYAEAELSRVRRINVGGGQL